MIYAQIKNGIVQNTIVLDDLSLEPLFAQGFDYFLCIDDIQPSPGIDWNYDGQQFSPPTIG